MEQQVAPSANGAAAGSSKAAAAAPGPTAASLQLLDGFLAGAGEEFAPVCAVLGGVVANNVVLAVSHSGAPLKNLFFYSLVDGRGTVEDLPPPGAADAAAGLTGARAAADGHGGEQIAVDTIEL